MTMRRGALPAAQCSGQPTCALENSSSGAAGAMGCSRKRGPDAPFSSSSSTGRGRLVRPSYQAPRMPLIGSASAHEVQADGIRDGIANGALLPRGEPADELVEAAFHVQRDRFGLHAVLAGDCERAVE